MFISIAVCTSFVLDKMKYIINALERLRSSEKDEDNDDDELVFTTEDIWNDMVRCIKCKFSLGQSKSSLLNQKKDDLRREYSKTCMEDSKSSNGKKRHTSLNVEYITVCETKKRWRSEDSLFDFAKAKIFSRARGSEGSVPGVVARKIEARRKEIEHLTRPQIVEMMRDKYNLNTKTG